MSIGGSSFVSAHNWDINKGLILPDCESLFRGTKGRPQEKFVTRCLALEGYQFCHFYAETCGEIHNRTLNKRKDRIGETKHYKRKAQDASRSNTSSKARRVALSHRTAREPTGQRFNDEESFVDSDGQEYDDEEEEEETEDEDEEESEGESEELDGRSSDEDSAI